MAVQWRNVDYRYKIFTLRCTYNIGRPTSLQAELKFFCNLQTIANLLQHCYFRLIQKTMPSSLLWSLVIKYFWSGCFAPQWLLRPGVTAAPFCPISYATAGLRPTSIPSGILMHAAIWPQQIWAENWMGAVSLWGGAAGSPSNTMWPGPRPTSMPGFILIRPTVWPRCTNVTDRQDRTDRQRFDSIGRTVLETVAPKPSSFT